MRKLSSPFQSCPALADIAQKDASPMRMLQDAGSVEVRISRLGFISAFHSAFEIFLSQAEVGHE